MAPAGPRRSSGWGVKILEALASDLPALALADDAARGAQAHPALHHPGGAARSKAHAWRGVGEDRLADGRRERTSRRVHSYNDDYADLDGLRRRITQLNAEGMMDKQVAAVLNEEGVVSARHGTHLLTRTSGCCGSGGGPRSSCNPNGRKSAPLAGWLVFRSGAAAAIGVTPQAIFDYLAKGLLTGRQITKGQPWQIDLTIEQLDRLRQRLLRTRRSKGRHHETLCSPNTPAHSPKLRLVVMITLVRS